MAADKHLSECSSNWSLVNAQESNPNDGATVGQYTATVGT